MANKSYLSLGKMVEVTFFYFIGEVIEETNTLYKSTFKVTGYQEIILVIHHVSSDPPPRSLVIQVSLRLKMPIKIREYATVGVN